MKNIQENFHDLHIWVSKSDYVKLKEYGKGVLRDSIPALIKIAESKEINVKIELEFTI